MGKKISRFVYWAPRILSIIFILFLAMFSLDIFGNGYTFWQTILGLLMHNIPVFFLIAILVVSWKYEIAGGIAFILAGMLYTGGVLFRAFMNVPHQWFMIFWSIPIAGPAFLIGILFLINWHKKKA